MDKKDKTEQDKGLRIGYARVSTVGQMLDGTSLETQTKRLREAGCVDVYREAHTGSTVERPELNNALRALREGDVLVVTDLDRLGRTVRGVIDTLDDLDKKGVGFECLAFPDLPREVMGFLVPILTQVAQIERQKILERTAAGREAARLKREERGEDMPTRGHKYGSKEAKKLAKFLGAGLSLRSSCKAVGVSPTAGYSLIDRFPDVFDGVHLVSQN